MYDTFTCMHVYQIRLNYCLSHSPPPAISPRRLFCAAEAARSALAPCPVALASKFATQDAPGNSPCFPINCPVLRAHPAHSPPPLQPRAGPPPRIFAAATRGAASPKSPARSRSTVNNPADTQRAHPCRAGAAVRAAPASGARSVPHALPTRHVAQSVSFPGVDRRRLLPHRTCAVEAACLRERAARCILFIEPA